MESLSEFVKPFRVQTRRWFLVVGLLAVTYLLFQSLLFPYGKALQSLLPDGEVLDESSLPTLKTLTKSLVRNPLTVNASDKTSDSVFREFVEDEDYYNLGGDTGHDSGLNEIDRDLNDDFVTEGIGQDSSIELVTDREVDDEDVEDLIDSSALDSAKDRENSSIPELPTEARHDLPLEQIVKPNREVSTENTQERHASQTAKNLGPEIVSTTLIPLANITYKKIEVSKASSSVSPVVPPSNTSTSKNVSALIGSRGKKKMRCELPPKTVISVNEMEHILMRHHRSSRAMRPRSSSRRDQEVLAAKAEIKKAPNSVNDRELYAPLFHNVSRFKRCCQRRILTRSRCCQRRILTRSRSYELMDRTLKVYVYRDGNKPIFHQPILKGLYASEGWFMKLMEGNKHFVVKDPRNAHLFYMPFSSRMLEYALYVRNSHNRTNLRQYLKNYSEKIAAKYPYWNRTGGADHFLVACHDWAPYETRHHMEHCVKALCNADVTAGFKIGRDVSLPETYVRSARNPLRDLGGKPPSDRHILAFYAGNIHGYLRPILLKYWKDKDPDMKIFGPMPPGVASKMNYIQHMKNSKYCICPKGYEVNSPRVVEAIFYECVPVIVSDNFVPPFFEVLNWGAFSVIIAESEIPNLKNILLSIPKEKYLQMQLAVRKVQRHFLWHAKPKKYDLFHMTLHSIWYNRVHQIKPR
ncbi:probable glycosyltransferase At5g25310 isoform X2 [Mangifera indica]|uniref:probable glycosyltransferase At5g25310 isoform X2 n=1 Tax=Mangifera indica TaxID=29780 RepID=UPI001CFC26DE|nr:probable glycosyltransferase At5g25310 isoform X2 [Mangifera indica]